MTRTHVQTHRKYVDVFSSAFAGKFYMNFPTSMLENSYTGTPTNVVRIQPHTKRTEMLMKRSPEPLGTGNTLTR